MKCRLFKGSFDNDIITPAVSKSLLTIEDIRDNRIVFVDLMVSAIFDS
jgi:hypothetical protein